MTKQRVPENVRREVVRIDLTDFDPLLRDGYLEMQIPAIEAPFDVFKDLAHDMGYRGRDIDLFVDTMASAIYRFGILKILGDRI